MSQGTTLHVAALPFPSHQGTQAIIGSMLRASAAAGRDTHLLCYAHGVGEAPAGVRVHRIADVPRRRSLRSGPSLSKLALDASLALHLSRLVRTLRPRLIVAHHVEAAAAALPHGPTLFFAHTDLGAELPGYAPQLPAALLGSAGRALDTALIARSDAVATISPLLAERMRALHPRAGERIQPVSAPWPVPAPTRAVERREAREALGIAEAERVLLYTGNLDAYQSWPTMLDAVALAGVTLLVGTGSDTAELQRQLRAMGPAPRVHVVPLDDEARRRALHAAADLAIVPRSVPGGLPIKLLDALCRGLPAVATETACAGLALPGVLPCGEQPAQMAAAIRGALARPDELVRLGAAARAHLTASRSDARFLAELDGQAARARQHHARRARSGLPAHDPAV